MSDAEEQLDFSSSEEAPVASDPAAAGPSAPPKSFAQAFGNPKSSKKRTQPQPPPAATEKQQQSKKARPTPPASTPRQQQPAALLAETLRGQVQSLESEKQRLIADKESLKCQITTLERARQDRLGDIIGRIDRVGRATTDISDRLDRLAAPLAILVQHLQQQQQGPPVYAGPAHLLPGLPRFGF